MQKTILVVDDDKAILDSVKLILDDEGYQVLTEEDGGAAEDKARKALPDLILLDLWLPDSSGIEVLKRLKNHKETKSIPVILISALSNAQALSRRTQAADFIAKPFEIGDLLKKIKKYA